MTSFVSIKWSKSDSELDSKKRDVIQKVYNFKIRFFTPIKELDLCGHATVASSLLLAKLINNAEQTTNLEFESKSKVKLEALVNNSNQFITISMPSHPPKLIVELINEQWIEDIVENTLGPNLDNKSIVEEICLSQKFILIRFKDSKENNVLKVCPNFHNLVKINRNGLTNGIIVTQRADFDLEKVHFFSRVFLPFIGVNEDPVCGSAHCVLTPYWSQQLLIDNKLVAKQCSQRAGLLYCSLNKDRIQLSGNAIIIYEGIFNF
jgi:PhzF family phenazine biosynthesis protein